MGRFRIAAAPASLDPKPPDAVQTRTAGLLIVALLGAASCGDDPVVPALPVATTVDITPGSIGLSWLGQTVAVQAVVMDQDGSPMADVDVTWTTADPTVATVSPLGALSAAGDGTTTLTARAGEAEASVGVSVARDAAEIVIGADSLVLDDPGDDAALMLWVGDSGGAEIPNPAVVWSSSDPTIVSVDSTGIVTGEATGSATITATAGSASDSIVVRVAPQLTIVLVGETPLNGTVTGEVALSARVEELGGGAYSGARVIWSVGVGSGGIVSADVSTSDPTGYVGAVWRFDAMAGTQRAFASVITRGDTVSVEFLAAVGPGPAASATLVADTILLSAVGETAYLSPMYADAWGNPAAASAVAWTSRDPSVASVSADGLVFGTGPGTTWVVGTIGAEADSIEVELIERGAITITFDDGWRSVYDNAWPVFQDFSLRANVGVYTEAVVWPVYMSETQLDELHAAGWSMVSHTVSHDSLTTLSPAELDYELRTSQQWLDARGYLGSNVFIAPYHDFGPAERLAVSGYYVASRGTSTNIAVPDSLVGWKPDNPYELTGIEAEDLPYTTAAGRDRLRTILQRVTSEGAFVDVFFHQIPPENVADFRATLEVLDEFADRVLPYHELFPIWARGVN